MKELVIDRVMNFKGAAHRNIITSMLAESFNMPNPDTEH